MKSKYKYVYHCPFKTGSASKLNDLNVWQGYVRINHVNKRKKFKTERDAAIWVDKTLMENGLQPVNIFKPK